MKNFNPLLIHESRDKAHVGLAGSIMNDILREIIETNKVQTADGQTIPLQSHIPQFECEVIQAWIAEYMPKNIIEIGLGYGVSALFISDALRGMHPVQYHIIDAFQSSGFCSIGILNLTRAGYENTYIFYEELSEICLPRMLEQGLAFDFSLIDGMHTFDHVMLDFFYVNRMLKTGGVVIFDDIQFPSIKKTTDYISGLGCYTALPLPNRFRQTVKARARRMLNIPESRIIGFFKTKEDRRSFDWYKDF